MLMMLDRRQRRWVHSPRRQPPGLALRSARVTHAIILNFENKPQLNQMASIAFGVAISVITDMIFHKPAGVTTPSSPSHPHSSTSVQPTEFSTILTTTRSPPLFFRALSPAPPALAPPPSPPSFGTPPPRPFALHLLYLTAPLLSQRSQRIRPQGRR